MSGIHVPCDCGAHPPAPIHCRNCNEILGVPNCECGRPLRVIHPHKCDRCLRVPPTGRIEEPFAPTTWGHQQTIGFKGKLSTTTSTSATSTRGAYAEASKKVGAEPPKARAKKFVELWEYEENKLKHKVYEFED